MVRLWVCPNWFIYVYMEATSALFNIYVYRSMFALILIQYLFHVSLVTIRDTVPVSTTSESDCRNPAAGVISNSASVYGFFGLERTRGRVISALVASGVLSCVAVPSRVSET